MDSIKSQKLQAMKNYKAKFVYNLIIYSLTAFLSSLFYLYLFWFPSMRHFLFDFLPNIYSFFFSPKFLFVLGNIIILILVGESKLGRASHSSPASEIYDEYVEKSRSSLRRKPVVEGKKKDRKLESDKNEKSTKIRRHTSLNNIRALEGKKKEKTSQNLSKLQSVVVHNCNENEKKNEVVSQSQTLKRPQSLVRLENYEKTTILKKTTEENNVISQSLDRPQSRLDHMHEKHEKITSDVEMSIEEKRKEMEQSKDELNRRVEAFIARVSRQRMIEAREFDFSS